MTKILMTLNFVLRFLHTIFRGKCCCCLQKGLLYPEDGVIIDDAAFRLHYAFTTYLLLFSSFLVTGKVYLGSPIQCTMGTWDFGKIVPKDMLNSYCYIHSTFIIPPQPSGDGERKVDQSYPGIFAHTRSQADEFGLYLSYYQWVPLLLFIQGLTFFLPSFFWKTLENGTVKHLRMSLHEPALDPNRQRENIESLVAYFKKNAGRHGLYGKHYLYCLFMSLLNLVVQVILTNLFLGGSFLAYGFTFTYTTQDRSSRIPMQDILFPKMAKCPMHLFGPSGTKQLYDGLCVLPLNILHDKIYLALWYWYLTLAIITLSSITYWTYHFCNKSYRLKHIERHLKGHALGNRLRPFNATFGDWLILHHMYKNVEHENFLQLVNRLAGVRVNEVRKLKRNETNIRFDLGSGDSLVEQGGESSPSIGMQTQNLVV